ncbi:lysine exporter LysO family protein [Martelella alba]|uniref:Lysine exporter LysO family protein n=1 Tax=Martelella alba TaxID=2590451 RepID=A0ABY2ST62_9HYPH|nr:lysine exporter LysO family protein [Martelella alba]TKI07466.1 lysine exporter LysO family protein [Martelella alba]
MYSGLLIILLPLIAGYLLPCLPSYLVRLVDRVLSGMVYVILFFMGISLAFLDNLAANLMLIAWYAGCSASCILACNAVVLWQLEKRAPWRADGLALRRPASRWRMALDSLKLCLVVAAGFLIGLSQWHWLTIASKASEFALLLLLMLVGIQLRNSGMTLRQILVNRRGASIALAVVLSSLAGGVLAAAVMGLPLRTGLALSSAFGWYSLSGILMSDAFGPVVGSAAFFNDLTRELLAIMLIPSLMRRSRVTALGLCGATSMDFTLPVLQRSGGLDVVPAAIVHGFLLSLLAPVLIALFTA